MEKDKEYLNCKSYRGRYPARRNTVYEPTRSSTKPQRYITMCSRISQKTQFVKCARWQRPRAPDAETDLRNVPMGSHLQPHWGCCLRCVVFFSTVQSVSRAQDVCLDLSLELVSASLISVLSSFSTKAPDIYLEFSRRSRLRRMVGAIIAKDAPVCSVPGCRQVHPMDQPACQRVIRTIGCVASIGG